MFLKDKYENGILKVRTTIRIVQGTLGDVPKSEHLRNHIPKGNIDVKLYVFKAKYENSILLREIP